MSSLDERSRALRELATNTPPLDLLQREYAMRPLQQLALDVTEVWAPTAARIAQMGDHPERTSLGGGGLPESMRREERVPVVVPLSREAEAPSDVLSVEAIQTWDGVVESINDDFFVGRLYDRTNRNGFDAHTAEFLIDDVASDDRSLLSEGALFNYVIYRRRLKSGTVERLSRLTFRRIPAWSATVLGRAAERADEMAEYFGTQKKALRDEARRNSAARPGRD